jgi:hypothetical protein
MNWAELNLSGDLASVQKWISGVWSSFLGLPTWAQGLVAAATVWILFDLIRERIHLFLISLSTRAKRWGLRAKGPSWIPLGKSGKVACRHCYSPYVPTREKAFCPTCGRDPY